ncbi:MAG TPA: methyltransferase domain-containing protein [Candidatus Omnitrophota bacterium]|nr:methyltransferase domain-containing protein [Candidatus Omnitrophota bacterium]
MKNSWRNKKQTGFLVRGPGRYLHRERLGCIIDALDRISGAGKVRKTLVDLGCGEAVITGSLDAGRYRLYGVDADINRLRVALRNGHDARVSFINADILAPSIRDASADVVLLHHVIEHLEGADVAALQICRRLLLPGGYLIVGIPNEGSIPGRMMRGLHRGLYEKGEHANFYSERDILALLERSGFSVESVARIGFLIPVFYIHMAFLGIKPVFYFLNMMTQLFKHTADSLIVVCRKGA